MWWPTIRTASPSSKQLNRYLHAAAFVGLWMAIGWIFKPDTNSYLLIGVPLTVSFQVLVRRKPILALWVRDAAGFRPGILAIVLGLALAVLPVMTLIGDLKSGSWRSHVPETLWSLCAVGGAFGAGFSLGHFTKQTWACRPSFMRSSMR